MRTTVDFEMTSIAPMLMHCDRFVNPISDDTIEHKKLTSKRTKTKEDFLAIAKSEWMASVYYDEKLGVYVPTNMIRACLIEGAKLFKLGRHVQRSVLFLEYTGFSLKYKGPKDLDELFKIPSFVDSRSVRVSTSKLFRYRPRFESWSLSGSLNLNESMLSFDDLKKSFEAAGEFSGIGDYRPMFGTFDVKF